MQVLEWGVCQDSRRELDNSDMNSSAICVYV